MRRTAGRDVLSPELLQRACRLLGWTRPELDAVMRPCKSQSEAERALEEMKKRIKARYRICVRALHPDRGCDPAYLRHVNAAWEDIQRKRAVPRRPQPQRVHAPFSSPFGGAVQIIQQPDGSFIGVRVVNVSSTSASTTSTTGFGGFGGWPFR